MRLHDAAKQAVHAGADPGATGDQYCVWHADINGIDHAGVTCHVRDYGRYWFCDTNEGAGSVITAKKLM